MIYKDCPKCGKELEINEYELEFIPFCDKCECGEKYCIIPDCDYDEDAVLIIDFYEYHKKRDNI
jgi:hypothetical protein